MKYMLALAAMLFAAPAMAQTIPPPIPPPNFAGSATQLRNAGGGLIADTASVESVVPGLGVAGRNVIEQGTGPNGIIGTNPVHFRNLGTIHGSIPN